MNVIINSPVKLAGRSSAQPAHCAADQPQSERFPFPAFFEGWYRVSEAMQVRTRRVLAARAFGTDLAIFRGDDGVARVFDAHCPHLGANLVQGSVRGSTLTCPFHGWRFDEHGKCEHAPGSDRTPRAGLRVWPSREIDGVIVVWFSARGGPPRWEPSSLPEFEDRRWTRPHAGHTRLVRTHVQELGENGVDLAHFAITHRFHIAKVASALFTVDKECLRHVIIQELKVFGLARFFPDLRRGILEYDYQGPGIVTVRTRSLGALDVQFITRLYFTPVDSEHCAVSSSNLLRKFGLLTPILYMAAVQGAEDAIRQDTDILEKKVFRQRPVLTSADGPILAYRHWARQFYTEVAAGEDLP